MVVFNDSPTVPNAETHSKRRFLGDMSGSNNVRQKKDIVIIIIDNNMVALARLIESGDISLENISTRLLFLDTDTTLSNDTAKVVTFTPPAVD